MKPVFLGIMLLMSLAGFFWFLAMPLPETTIIYNGTALPESWLGLPLPLLAGGVLSVFLLLALLLFFAGFGLMLIFWLGMIMAFVLALLFPFLWILLLPLLLYGWHSRRQHPA